MIPKVFVKRLHPNAVLPRFAYAADACADICSVEDKVLAPNSFDTVRTGLAFSIPEGYEIQVRPRSGLAAKYGISILNSPGTVDSTYRGEIKVVLMNHGIKPFHIEVGNRIAQLALRSVPDSLFIEVDDLDDTERGEGGFGSTGI